MKTKILLVDDHPFTRAGVRAIVETDKTLEVVGEAVDGNDAIDKVKALQPDIVVMDINMPNLSGIDATKEILKTSSEVKIIALSIHSGEQFVKEMLDVGAVGYLLKDEAPEELLMAIKKVDKGEMFLSSAVTRTALSKTISERDLFNVNILQTKLHRPPVLDDYVVREKIIEELEKNIIRPLSVISAGAGYGKSVTVSEWLEQTRFLHTWLSLDEEHNDFRMFMLYLCAAIEKLFPGSLENTGNLLAAANLPPFEVISNSLINELCDIDQEFILVLDDYHSIRERKVHWLFDKWLRFPPPNIHLTIVTRRDPPLDMRALRANNRMTEIRMANLRFSDKEIASLFKKLLGIDLSDQTITKLQEKTEGWIIGLRMASLAIKDQEDINRLIEAIEGDMHYISDYLISEVLSVQPQHIQDQLIDSSVLDRFCAELIGEIMLATNKTEQKITEGEELIQWLIKSNLFIIPLDNEQKWFRYHHLFKDLLQNQSRKLRTKKQINEIYRKASKWFENNDFISEAIDLSMKAKDTDTAVKIISDHWEDTIDKDLWYIVEGWLNLLPDKVIVKSGSLLLARMWITIQSLRLEDVPALIELIEKYPDDLAQTEQGYLAFAKSLINYSICDTQKALDYSEQALQLIPKKYYCMRGDINAWRIVELQSSGKGKMGVEMAKEELKNVNTRDDHPQLMRLVLRPNFVYIIDANLPALRTGMDSFFKVPNISPYILGFGLYFRAIICWWGYDLEGVVRKFDILIKKRFQTALTMGIEGYICTALALQEMNRQQDVTDVIKRATDFVMELDNSLLTSILDSAKARLNLKQGNLEAAEKWLNSKKHSGIDPSMLYWVEIPAITQCRVLIAIATSDSLNKALELLREYREYSESFFHKLRTIEVAVLQAHAYFKLQNEKDASETLKYALELAADGEWIRPFVEVAEELKSLLTNLKEQNVKPGFIDEILDHLKQETVKSILDDEMQIQEFKQHEKENLSLLTSKEMDVLHCIEEGLRNQEIASKLYNSEGTIKKHVSNMFQKMNVRNRLSLIIRAKEIGILKSK
ncbi:MAG: response regulator [Bacteroidota bacterium]